jgi:hypothetical protein
VTDPTDIKALDEYLERDSEISQRYRELGRDEVPPELDRRVLAAAREAVASDSAKRSRSWVRWSAPVALAASVVLVVTVVLERGVQDEAVLLPQSADDVRQVPSRAAGEVVRDDQAANAADEAKVAEELTRQPGFVAEPVVAPPLPVAPRAATAEAFAKAEAEPKPERPGTTYSAAPLPDSTETQGAPIAIQTVPPVAPTPAPVAQISARKSAEASEAEKRDTADVSEIAVTGSRARRATGRTVGPRNTISSGSFRSESQMAPDERRERSDPQAWLEDIRELRRAGKTAEADREWQLFRGSFPDFRVADDDIARQQP